MFRQSLAVMLLVLAVSPVSAATWAESLFDELSHDFGLTPRGPVLEHSFHVTNRYNTPVTISSVRVSCGCVTASVMQATLQPGQSTTVLAQMDTRRFIGSKSVTIYVQLSQPRAEEVRLNVQAVAREDFTITPETLAFGPVPRGQAAKRTVTVSFLGSPSWAITGATCESNFVQPTVRSVGRVGAETAYEVTANLRQDIPVGSWFTDVYLTSNLPGVSRLRIPLTVEVQALLTSTPATVTFGRVTAGNKVERKIILKSSQPFTVREVKSSSGVIIGQVDGKTAKALHVVNVSLSGEQIGELKQSLKIKTDLPMDSEIEVPVLAVVEK